MNVILSAIKRGFRDHSTIISNIFMILILPFIFSLIYSFEFNGESVDLDIMGDKSSTVVQSYTLALDAYEKETKGSEINYRIYSEKEFDKLEEKNNLTVVIDEEGKNIGFLQNNSLQAGEIAVQSLT